ncbi:unnamed protein product [Caenorhabditis auriculariae]|uniref:Major facilitator superfamily (MFS) profile domain-containing protein n=1 Tax=Caenorhabditis auriculariae TaxID=2777116 RepID=A0A8S1HNJ1_9PELO|nr:unnamed protein product [Caenorhabditis auriculariae]
MEKPPRSSIYRFIIMLSGFLCLVSINSNHSIINFTFICMRDDMSDVVETNNGTFKSIYDYGENEKSMILAFVGVGTTAAMVPVNYLYIHYGARLPFFIACLVSSFSTIFIPYTAKAGLGYLLFVRFMQGAAYSADFAAIGMIVSRWAPIKETAIFIGILTTFTPVSSIITNFATGHICHSSLGWKWSFYFHAVAGAILAVAWFLIYSDDPSSDVRVSKQELTKIQKHKSAAHLENTTKIPVIRAVALFSVVSRTPTLMAPLTRGEERVAALERLVQAQSEEIRLLRDQQRKSDERFEEILRTISDLTAVVCEVRDVLKCKKSYSDVVAAPTATSPLALAMKAQRALESRSAHEKDLTIVVVGHQEAEQEDLTGCAREILSANNIDPTHIAEVFRHGTKRAGSTRIIKVKLTSRKSYFPIKKALGQSTFGTFARDDLSIEELKEDRRLRQQCHIMNQEVGRKCYVVRDLAIAATNNQSLYAPASLHVPSKTVVLCVWTCAFTELSCLVFVTQYGPLYFSRVLQFNVTETGFWLAVVLVAHLPFRFLVAVISDKTKCMSEMFKIHFFNTLAVGAPGAVLVAFGLVPVEHKYVAIAVLAFLEILLGCNCGGFYKSGTLHTRQFSQIVLSGIQFMKCIALLVGPALYSIFVSNDTNRHQWVHIFGVYCVFMVLATLLSYKILTDRPAPWTEDTEKPTTPEVRYTDVVNKNVF